MFVTVVTPGGKVLPLAGILTRLVTAQLSEAVTEKVTLLRLHWPASAFNTRLGGHVLDGTSVSSTITRKELLTPSVLVNDTVLVLSAKNEPFVGEKVNWAQSPVVIGGVKFTTAPHWPGSLFVMVLNVPITK